MRTLYLNGDIYSVSSRDASALLIDGADIAWIGDDDTARGFTVDRTFDLRGALVTPAFVDSHVHTTATGLSLIGLDLSRTATLAEALNLIEAQARKSRGRPILGGGWDETRWPEQRPPTVNELDRAGYGGAVFLSRIDGHSAVVSSSMLITVPDVRGLAGFRPDGLVTTAAHDALRVAAYSALPPSVVEEAQRAMRNRAASLGIAALHEMAGPEVSSADDLAGLLKLASAEPGPEIFGYWGELFGVQTALELGAIGAGGDLFCDGSLGSHTAALHQPYSDASDIQPAPRLETAEIVEHARQAVVAGLHAGFHAIGDAAVDRVIDAMEALADEHGPRFAAGHRLEHAAMVRDANRLAASGLTASLQPAFDANWGGAEGMYAERVGTERLATMHRFSELAAAGVPLAFGSDAPVTPPDPWRAVQAAAYPQEKTAAVTPRAAFLAHTRGGWRAARADADGSGALAPGAPATLAVWSAGGIAVDAIDDRLSRWSTDPRAAIPGLPDLRPGSELPSCLQTVLRGEVIFSGDLQ
ncbi:hypothetical protein SAMN05892883_3097 [Jatrophihabitans sp. GAS493]|uniref:amidohydrolase n=1 Tax=Jatrophihabitans sp. GAS493 TaxID=1907575 RepID=UPI000BB99C4D|nr:amidohydrolase family protein [Jatrophihabitans sp. GAS493]SOD73903.1 hypothetical protein SAMN05892883_3097 [Jatrophihabitans sp. GAS493]